MTLPPALARSPWIEACAAATAATCAVHAAFRLSWTVSTRTAGLAGLVAAVVAGVAAHAWSRREERKEALALDTAHLGLMRGAIASIVSGGTTFSSHLATTELFAVPFLALAIGWLVLLRLVLVDRRRVAWVAAVRRGERPALRVVDRPLDAPLAFAGTSGELTIVRGATEAFRGDEPAVATLPRDATRPPHVARRWAAALLLAPLNLALIAMTLGSGPRLGLPTELVPRTGPGIRITRVGEYPFLKAPGLAFYAVDGPGDAHRLVALERSDRQRARVYEGRALFLRVRCEDGASPTNAIACARWASDVLSGHQLILSGADIQGRRVVFDGHEYPAPSQPDRCFTVDLDTAVMNECSPRPAP